MSAHNDHADTTTKTTAKVKQPLWQKIVLGAAALIGLIIVLAYVATGSIAKTSDEFLQGIQNKNANQAYSLFTKEAAAATDRAAFEELVDNISGILHGPTKTISREVQGETGKAGTGRVVYEISGTDSVTYVVTINLQKEEGEWKVLNFDSSKK